MTTSTPLIKGVDFVGVPTRDFDAAVEFYGTVLGLSCSARYGKSPGAEFETGNLTLAVYESEAFGVEFHPNKHGIALHVEDVEAARAALESRVGERLRPSGPRRLGSFAALPYDRPVAYDEELADRIRELIGSDSDLTERKMFGGLAFLIGGNMAVAASGQGGVLVRVDPAQSDTLVATTSARPMEMRGRQMRGWLRVDPEDLRTKRHLAKWVELGTTYARSLPAKQ